MFGSEGIGKENLNRDKESQCVKSVKVQGLLLFSLLCVLEGDLTARTDAWKKNFFGGKNSGQICRGEYPRPDLL
jgi:hypothetical protein